MTDREAARLGPMLPAASAMPGRRVSERTGLLPFQRRLFRRVLPRIGFSVLVVVLLGALLAPWLTPYKPDKADFSAVLQPPSVRHWLGTDELGRDQLARLLYGARVSLFAGTAPLAVSFVIGTVLGLLAGTMRGHADQVIMRIVDAFMAFPSLVLMIAIAGILGPSLRNALIAMGLVGFGGVARLVRGQTLAIAQQDYVLAARCLGVSPVRIMRCHILPNSMSPIIVSASLRVGGFILAEASLSFLGMGTQLPSPSWGNMVSAGNVYLQLAPWLSIVPGMAIFVTVLAANFLGDGIRDALDPMLVER